MNPHSVNWQGCCRLVSFPSRLVVHGPSFEHKRAVQYAPCGFKRPIGRVPGGRLLCLLEKDGICRDLLASCGVLRRPAANFAPPL